MNFKALCFFIPFTCLCYLARTQNDSLPASWRISGEEGGGRIPAFSPFCSDRIWLGRQGFDVVTRRSVPDKSTYDCIPKSALHLCQRDPDEHAYLWWEADPYDNSCLWAKEVRYNPDTIILWRYDIRKSRIDSFAGLAKYSDVVIGKPGIWTLNRRTVVLRDRLTGKILRQVKVPNKTDGRQLGTQSGKELTTGHDQYNTSAPERSLRPWGEDVLVFEQWLYQRKLNRFIPFFALPADMEGCKSPLKLDFKAEVCLSRVREDNGFEVDYLSAPDQNPIHLLLDVDGYWGEYLLSVNPPLVWMGSREKLIAVDYTTGDTLNYAAKVDHPLNGDQNGRFLGFANESGLSFFDKYSCQFRVLDLPLGDEPPRNFTSDGRYIYLTFSDRSEIIDFSRLGTAFQQTQLLADYHAFQSELYISGEAIRYFSHPLNRSRASDFYPQYVTFYPQYATYLEMLDRYGHKANPKIAKEWDFAKMGLIFGLKIAPDSLLDRIASDYEAGRFDSSVSNEITYKLFQRWSVQGYLSKVQRLLSVPANKDYIEHNIQYGKEFIQLIDATQYQLDSLAKCAIPPDERLYATGKIWLDYTMKERELVPRYAGRFVDQAIAFDHYRTLIKRYPYSAWADNAAFDTLYQIDNYNTMSDENDETYSRGNKPAYIAFTQFLKNYPDSDRRPEALLHLAMIIQYGVRDGDNNRVNKMSAAAYMETIARDYPKFASISPEYQVAVDQMKAINWLNDWKLTIIFNKTQYKPTDNILVHIQMQNTSKQSQVLDTTFLHRWPEGLHMKLAEMRDRNCETLEGNFPLFRKKEKEDNRSMIIKPGATLEEVFILGRKSIPTFYGSFELAASHTYTYSLRYYHPVLKWLQMKASPDGEFQIE